MSSFVDDDDDIIIIALIVIIGILLSLHFFINYVVTLFSSYLST